MSLNYKYYNANGEQVTEEGGEESFVAKLEVFAKSISTYSNIIIFWSILWFWWLVSIILLLLRLLEKSYVITVILWKTFLCVKENMLRWLIRSLGNYILPTCKTLSYKSFMFVILFSPFSDDSLSFYECHYPPCCKIETEVTIVKLHFSQSYCLSERTWLYVLICSQATRVHGPHLFRKPIVVNEAPALIIHWLLVRGSSIPLCKILEQNVCNNIDTFHVSK